MQNLRVLSQYYTRISSSRIAELLQLSEDEPLVVLFVSLLEIHPPFPFFFDIGAGSGILSL